MSEFALVETVADFRQLDDGEILEGYFDGISMAATGTGSGSLPLVLAWLAQWTR